MNQNDPKTPNDPVERLLRQAEISRITRTLKSKLASASLETRMSPLKSPDRTKSRRRAKTLEGAMASPVPFDTPSTARKPRGQYSRPSSVVSVSSASSQYSGLESPYGTIPRMPSYRSLPESAAISPPRESLLITPNRNHETPLPSVHLTAPPDSYEPLPREPQTPPPAKSAGPKTPIRSSKGAEDGANLLLHFAASPGRTETPKTPDFNMGEYLNLQTPSPAKTPLTPRRMQWTSLNSALFGQTPFRS